MNIGENIHNFRKQLKMTQAELAAEAGLSIMTIRRYESGAATPTLERIGQLAAVLGVSNDEILYGKSQYMNVILDGQPALFINPGKGHPFHVPTEEEREIDAIKQEIDVDLDKLNMTGKKVAAERINELTLIGKYTK